MTDLLSHAAPVRIDGAALRVRSLSRQRGFYETALGLVALEETPDRVVLGAPARQGGAPTPLLTLLGDPSAAPEDRKEAGLFHIAYLLPDRASLGGWLAHAEAAGFRLAGAADHNVSEALYLDDAEGFGVEVYVDRPADAWRRRADGRIDMVNEQLDLGALKAEGAHWRGFPSAARIGHAHLRVGNLAATEAFYAGALGLAREAETPGAAFFGSGGYHHHVSANVWTSAGAGPRRPRAAGLVALALSATPPAFDAIAARAGRDGAKPLELTDPWGHEITVTRRDAA